MTPDLNLESTLALCRWMTKHCLSMPQFSALLHVARHKSATMTEIANGARVSTAAATFIVDKLEKLQWVLRTEQPGDRRTTKVIMREAGEKALEEIFKPEPDIDTLHTTFSR